MADQWETIVEDERLEDPLILDGLAPKRTPEIDDERATEARAREDALLAKDAERDLGDQPAARPRNRASGKVSPSRGPRTTGG